MKKTVRKSKMYVTGDIHGSQVRFLFQRYGLNECMGEGDILFVCGDFGFVFDDDEEEKKFLDQLEEQPYQILWVDGNHENFDVLYRYPVEEWCGGKVHRIRKNILHLMRGQVFTIRGKTFFTMGGAYSIDKAWREPNKSWWPQEMPSDEEKTEAAENLAKYPFSENTCPPGAIMTENVDGKYYRVNYILTHTAPEKTMYRFHPEHREEAPLNNFLQWVEEHVVYDHWYFGHLHEDKDIWKNQTVLFYGVRDIESNKKV